MPRPATSAMPRKSLYHRWLGWHASSLQRAVVVACVGMIVALVLLPFVTWEMAVVAGWDAAALVFLAIVWQIILRSGSAHAEQLARREDETRGSAAVLLIGASVASLLGVGFLLSLAGEHTGASRVLLTGLGVVTVVLSWTVVNSVYTLRYTDLHYASTAAGIAFGDSAGQEEQPSYRDFAYVAFTIGMTYQVSDTTVRNPRIRRTVLAHALLSYLFGVVIVGGSVNLVAGLIR
jgi:uncharacterized membrane protein